jgi:hypothetical protein
MSVTKVNIEAIIVQAAVPLQRMEQINQLCQGFRTGLLYRSPDGGIAIELTKEQLSQVETAIIQMLDEADTASAAIRAILGHGAAPSP